ncbi:putative 1-phosphatidylinositol 3-phosphate 5-kinase isoform X3 [Uranotaenia lowii]|uniref:putative 1-phosphatidylinositol 3-phosphate 5-kinase isoform X3 n=1 Tax=Uranotaenia lowii TaxID=190385 RepID=UPI0024796D1B|nr:putative 1-phosphatidylinositol 3-phosphate 5-kinase isoform X3 [Uranotaenia lowii]
MNLNLHSSTLLTEFAREKSNELESLFSKVVSKMTPGVYDNTGTGSLCAAPITEATNKIDSQIDQHSSGMTNNAQEEAIGRTSVNVIKHLSTIVNQKNLNYKKYKNTELQKLWMPDSTSIECYECSVKFSTFKRKHHCRLCGQIFCTKCCNQVVPGKIINCTDDLKVCTYCSKVVLMYLNSSNTAEDLKSDLKAFQEDLSNKLLPIQMVQNDESGRLTNKKEITVGYREERIVSNQINILSSADRKAILQQSNSLRTLFEEMVDFLPNQNHGFELIAFLVTAQKTSNNRQAMAILGAMIEAGYLLPLDVASTNSESFVDFNENDKNEVALFDDNAVYVFAPNKEATASSAEITEVAETDVIGQTAEDRLLQPETKENTQKEITYNDQEKCFIFSTGATVLLEAFCQHEDSLVNQLLHLNNLDVSWSKILIPIAARVANTMNPHTLADSMDIRHNVCFKKLPGGDRKECAILEGVCFTKNVVHRQMLARINNPKVLLLECSIAFQRVESKFVSFDTLMLQEKDYLKKKVSKILTWGANIVLVHKNVAGIAQEMLRSNGITLITDVKLSTLERIARCLDCDLLTSIDSNVGQPKLGTCDNFDIQRYNTDEGSLKTLLCLKTLNNSRGCCILLRGGSRRELVILKKILAFLIFTRYNWRMEMAFLCDEYAVPPTLPDSTIKDGKHMDEKSDVLRTDDESIHSNIQVTSKELSQSEVHKKNFLNGLRRTILTISPFIKISSPDIESAKNKLYFSNLWNTPVAGITINRERKFRHTTKTLNCSHKLTTINILTGMDEKNIPSLIADYRAYGGKYPKHKSMHRVHKRITDIGDVPKSGKNYVYKEALDIFNHQQLSVLFYSFYYNPNLPSSYCAQPSLLNMQFYGQNDIMLGDFLERYCFRSSHLCKSCNLPMMDHIRRYAHLQGYVQVDLKEDKNKLDTSAIVLTSKCKLCQKQISSQLSRDTWRLSFAKYLELRFCGHTYTCRNFENGKACKHSLHKDYIHYFTYKGVLAIFTYYSVNVWDICFPEMTYKSFDLKSISVELKILTSKGYDGFAKIVDKICDLAIEPDIYEKFLRKVNFDKTNFQRDIDTVESLVRNNSSIENVEDALLLLKKTMLENLDDCAFQLNSLSSRTEIDDKDKKESDRKGSRVLMDTTWNECAAVADLSDRARVKSNCLFPIMIHEQDLSSYIAYALTSSNYQIALDQLNADKTTDLCSNPVKQPIECSDNNDETFSKIDSTESKRSQKLNCHVDIPCQDGDHNFSCKIYFAKEFSKLRSLLITDPLTGDLKKRQYCKCNRVHCDNAITRKFARSLLRSFPWDARGGKSGSKFSKTIDDRFILKEMSRTDVTIFENFAPYLFDYIHDCLKYNQPTLLAKIFGIFKVTVKTKESTSIEKTVLVMENLFCNKNISRKFDLKGSLRNRLVDPQNQSGEVVLLDENFLQMSWKNPLYVLSNTHTVLHECIERDSSFLEKNGVMDYSLLLGINDDQSSLFVGIIAQDEQIASRPAATAENLIDKFRHVKLDCLGIPTRERNIRFSFYPIYDDGYAMVSGYALHHSMVGYPQHKST